MNHFFESEQYDLLGCRKSFLEDLCLLKMVGHKSDWRRACYYFALWSFISEGLHRRLAFACSTVEAEKGHGG